MWRGSADKTVLLSCTNLSGPGMGYDQSQANQNLSRGDSRVVQWLGLGGFTAEGLGSIPGWGTETPQSSQPK